jgi:hypothetical protein
MKLSWPVAALALLLPGFVLSQSLGELAEQQKAKRKNTGAKAYTNDDLERDKASPSPSPSPSASPDAQPGSSPAAGPKARFKVPQAAAPGQPATAAQPEARERPPQPSEGESSEEAKAKAPRNDEEYWRGQRSAREKAIQGLEDLIKEVERRLGELASDTNPNAADVMDPDRLRKRDVERREKAEQLERAKGDLVAARQHLAGLDEEARQAGVPPGWVR